MITFLRNSVLRADLLGAPTNLRSKGQPFYESVFGGLVSITMFLFFLIIFIFKMSDAFQLRLISYTEAQAVSLDDTESMIEKPIYSIKFPLLTKEEIQEWVDVKVRVIDFIPSSLLSQRRLLTSASPSDLSAQAPAATSCPIYVGDANLCYTFFPFFSFFTCNYYFQSFCYDSWKTHFGDDFDDIYRSWFETQEPDLMLEESQYLKDWLNYGTWKSKDDLSQEGIAEYNFFAGSHPFGDDVLIRFSTVNTTNCPSDYYQTYGIQDEQIDPDTTRCPEIHSNLINHNQASSKIKIQINCKKLEANGSCSVSSRAFFFSKYETLNSHVDASVLLLDTIFSPTDEKDTSNLLKRVKKLEFDNSARTIVRTELSTFSVETDQSFLPWSQIKQVEGYYVKNIDRYKLFSEQDENLISVYLEKSQTEFEIEREYGKIDDIISYFGGLFGLMFIVVSLLSGAFNEIRYELMVANKSFRTDGADNEKHFGLWSYIRYMLYDWLCFFNIEPKSWSRFKKIAESRDESNTILDVLSIQERILYLEHCVEVLLDENQRLCIRFLQKPGIEEVILKRKLSEKILQYAEKEFDFKADNVAVQVVDQLQADHAQPQQPELSQVIERREQALKMLFQTAGVQAQPQGESKTPEEKKPKMSLFEKALGLKEKNDEQNNSKNQNSIQGIGKNKEMSNQLCFALENLISNKPGDKVSQVIRSRMAKSKKSKQYQKNEKAGNVKEDVIGFDDVQFVPMGQFEEKRESVFAESQKVPQKIKREESIGFDEKPESRQEKNSGPDMLKISFEE